MVETSKMNWADPSRGHVKDAAEKKKNVKVGLYFPSHSCNDLRRAIKLGVITKKTFLIIVEGDRDKSERNRNLKEIRRFLTLNKLYNVHIHSSRVHTLNLKKVLAGRKIDLCFFDICGNYTSEIADWFNKFQECFAHNMSLPMTLAIHPRGPKNSNLFTAVEKVVTDSLNDLGLGNIPNDILGSENINCPNLLPDIRSTIKAIYFTFSRRIVKFKNIKPYKFSTTNMVNFEVMIGGSKEEDTTFEDIAVEQSKKACDAVKMRKPKKTKKQKMKKYISLKSAADIARHMGIDKLTIPVNELPQGQQAWITMNANRAGLDPIKVKEKIDRMFYRNKERAA